MVIIATDSFKGCLTSRQAGEAIAAGVAQARPGEQVEVIDMSDGGEGMLDALAATMCATIVEAPAHDALGRPITAEYALAADGTAIIETARIVGLPMLAPGERNPLIATTRGVGEVIDHAAGRGSSRFIVGLGGSATSDCGLGMLRHLGLRYDGHSLDFSQLRHRSLTYTLAVDTRAPLLGDNGAARLYAPQKGASSEMVTRLEQRAEQFAAVSAAAMGYDRSMEPFAGAAGGLGYAFMQFYNANARSGADLLLDSLDFDRLLRDATLVITGEGHADRQTLTGKLPYAVLRRAKRCHVPVVLVAGGIDDSRQLLDAGFAMVVNINPTDDPIVSCLNPATARRRLSLAGMRLGHRR